MLYQVAVEWQTIVTNVNWTFVINLVQFFILVVVLNSLIYKPLAKFLEARETRLATQLAEAEQQREDAETLRSQREGELREANLESRKILEAARQEGAEIRRRMRAEADAEGRAKIETARAAAEAQLKPVRDDLEKQVDKLATAAANRVLGKK